MKLLKKIGVLLLSLALLGTVGCVANNTIDSETTLSGQPFSLTGESSTQTTTAQDTTQPNQQAVKTMDVAVYYLKNSKNDIYLVREVHKINKSIDVARAALNELITGKPLTKGAYRVLPAGTKILGIKISQGIATVDFSGEVLKANVGASAEAHGIDSMVNTLTEFSSIKKVQFTVDGQAKKGMDWWGHVGLYEQPFTRNLSSVNEPAIWVTSPVSGQTIASPVMITGNAMVFEALVNFRIKDKNGVVLAKGSTQAAIGTPERGDFTAKLAFTPTAAGEGQLEVYEVSMKDGSEVNKVIIPIKWKY